MVHRPPLPPVKEKRHSYRRRDDSIYTRVERLEDENLSILDKQDLILEKLEGIEGLLNIYRDTKGFFSVVKWLAGFAILVGGAWAAIKGMRE